MQLLIADSDSMLTGIYDSFFSGEGYDVVTVGGCLRKPFRLRKLSGMVRSITQNSPPRTAGGLLRR